MWDTRVVLTSSGWHRIPLSVTTLAIEKLSELSGDR